MRLFWTVVAILAALLVQTALGRLAPAHARLLDPFLWVVVYCGLTEDETHGMLAGMMAGWVQDIHFGGAVLGLSGLTKALVGFAVGASSARFHLADPMARILVLLAATVLDAVLLERLIRAFDLPVNELSAWGLGLRAVLNATLGLALFTFVDRHVRRLKQP